MSKCSRYSSILRRLYKLRYRLSNLHLLRWEHVIIDLTDIKNIRSNSNRGKAILELCCDDRVAIIDEERNQYLSTSDISTPTKYRIKSKRKHRLMSPQDPSPNLRESKYSTIATPNDTHKHRVRYSDKPLSEATNSRENLRMINQDNLPSTDFAAPRLTKYQQVNSLDRDRIRDIFPLLKLSHRISIEDVVYQA